MFEKIPQLVDVALMPLNRLWVQIFAIARVALIAPCQKKIEVNILVCVVLGKSAKRSCEISCVVLCKSAERLCETS